MDYTKEYLKNFSEKLNNLSSKFSFDSSQKPSDFVKKNQDKGVLTSDYTIDLLVNDKSPKFVLKVWETTIKGYRVVPESNNTEIQLIVDLEKKIVTERIKGYMGYPDSFKNVSKMFNFSDHNKNFSLPRKKLNSIQFKDLGLDKSTKDKLEEIIMEANRKETDHGYAYAYEEIFNLLVDSWK